MRKNSNDSQQFEDEISEFGKWDLEDDWEAENAIHAGKKHQDHRRRDKVSTRRSIDDFMEQKQLRELLGEDYDS